MHLRTYLWCTNLFVSSLPPNAAALKYLNIKENSMSQTTGLDRTTHTDAFYTSPETASALIAKVAKHYDLSSFDHIIEPSAGAGAFSDWFRKHKLPIKAYDIDPNSRAKYIKKQDFLDPQFTPIKPINKRVLTIGNPPFGRQSTLTKQFIVKASSYSSVIAFILPKSFKKPSMTAAFPPSFHKVAQYDMNIAESTFYINHQPHHVPCIFQIWERREYNRKQSNTTPISQYFTFVNSKSQADFAIRRIGVYAGRLYPNLKDTTYSINSHYFIKLHPDISKHAFAATYNEEVRFAHNNTVGPKSISKPELVAKVNKLSL
jgi:hypothetical protein